MASGYNPTKFNSLFRGLLDLASLSLTWLQPWKWKETQVYFGSCYMTFQQYVSIRAMPWRWRRVSPGVWVRSSKSSQRGSAENTMPIPLQLRENCLKDCLDDLAKRWEEAFQRKGARLETEFEPSIPTFRFDYMKVQQAAANLLDHALRQALPNGTVTLRCLSRPEGAEVSLTGATEHDQKVFDNCPTSYSPPRNHQENLDLGLNVAQRLVLAHGGKIWVEPSSTRSKFVFVLPTNAP